MRFKPEQFLINQAIAQGFSNSFGFGVDLQLLVDVTHVERNRVNADVQLKRGSLVVVSFNQQLEQTRLVWG